MKILLDHPTVPFSTFCEQHDLALQLGSVPGSDTQWVAALVPTADVRAGMTLRPARATGDTYLSATANLALRLSQHTLVICGAGASRRDILVPRLNVTTACALAITEAVQGEAVSA
jgi:hypothetical protein